jgi:hypothetical protein
MQTMSAYVNQEPGRSKPPPVPSGSDRLIQNAGAYERGEDGEDRHILIVDPGQSRRNLKRIDRGAAVVVFAGSPVATRRRGEAPAALREGCRRNSACVSTPAPIAWDDPPRFGIWGLVNR